MATATFIIDPAILEAARLEAERRQTSLDQIVADYLANFAHPVTPTAESSETERERNRRELLELMHTSLLGDIDRPLTRDEIYAERTINTENLVMLMNEGAFGHIDQPMTREEIYAERTWPRS